MYEFYVPQETFHEHILNKGAGKVMLKILHARLKYDTSQELPDVQAVFSKSEEPEIKYQPSLDSRESKGIPKKHLPLSH